MQKSILNLSVALGFAVLGFSQTAFAGNITRTGPNGNAGTTTRSVSNGQQTTTRTGPYGNTGTTTRSVSNGQQTTRTGPYGNTGTTTRTFGY